MLREFLRKCPSLCGLEGHMSRRISRSILNDFDYELENPEGEFKFIEGELPGKRTEHLFLFKHLEGVNIKKANRCEKIVELVALKSYQGKYQTTEFDEPIAVLTAELAISPDAEIDAASDDVVAAGYWKI